MSLDPDTATVLLLRVPMLKVVFTPELVGNDRPALVDIVTRLLRPAEAPGVWAEYDARLHGNAVWASSTDDLRAEALAMGVVL